jgi:hypothetical protein
MLPSDSTLGLISCALGLIACAGWWIADKPRPAAVSIWRWPAGKRPTNADSQYLRIKTSRGELMLTEEAFATARHRAKRSRFVTSYSSKPRAPLGKRV